MGTPAELLAAFDRESATTRRVLERLPEAKTGFRPHPRSWTLGELGLPYLRLCDVPLPAIYGPTADEPG